MARLTSGTGLYFADGLREAMTGTNHGGTVAKVEYTLNSK